MISIPLTKGKIALVDDEDGVLASAKWFVKEGGSTTYARCMVGNRREGRACEGMHRVVAKRMGLSIDGAAVDHINGNGLDNRRSNIRRASARENGQNSSRKRRDGHGFKGVYYHQQAGAWCAAIRPDRRTVNLGLFDNIIDAAIAYDRAALSLFGEFARTNYPAFASGDLSTWTARKLPRHNTSGFVGVQYLERTKSWTATASRNNRPVHIGYFPTAEQAVAARKAYLEAC